MIAADNNIHELSFEERNVREEQRVERDDKKVPHLLLETWSSMCDWLKRKLKARNSLLSRAKTERRASTQNSINYDSIFKNTALHCQ